MQKRGQVTVFIIIGLILLILAGVFIMMRQQAAEEEPPEIVPEQLFPIKSFVDSCVRSASRDALDILGLQGGYIQVPESIRYDPLSYLPLTSDSTATAMKIPYWYYRGRNVIPSVDDMNLAIARYVEGNIGACLEGLAQFSDQYEINRTGNITAKASIGDKAVQVKVKAPMTVRILGEEGGTDHLGDPASPFRWIIDPLDGTTNFIHGKPNYGTIIALQENDKTILGVMILHEDKETYTAIRGEGCFLNGKRCSLRKTAGMHDAVLACNIAHRAHTTPDGLRVVPIPLCASIENYGNAIEEFAVVLKGWNDGVFFNGPKLWDVAAGCLMVEEAGGRSKTALKDPDDPRSGVLCAATTNEIFEEVEEFVFKTLITSP